MMKPKCTFTSGTVTCIGCGKTIYQNISQENGQITYHEPPTIVGVATNGTPTFMFTAHRCVAEKPRPLTLYEGKSDLIQSLARELGLTVVNLKMEEGDNDDWRGLPTLEIEARQ